MSRGRGRYRRRAWAQGRAGDLTERQRAAEDAIRAAGYELAYVPYCEDGETPGLLGYMGGVTLRNPPKVKVRTTGHDQRQIVLILEHELRHVLDPAWDCGNRTPWDSRPTKGTPEWREWMEARGKDRLRGGGEPRLLDASHRDPVTLPPGKALKRAGVAARPRTGDQEET